MVKSGLELFLLIFYNDIWLRPYKSASLLMGIRILKIAAINLQYGHFISQILASDGAFLLGFVGNIVV